MKPYFPKDISEAFLLVDLVNNVNKLAEEQDAVLMRVLNVASTMHTSTLRQAVLRYGGVRAKKMFSSLNSAAIIHAA
jgi:hypothetical protein